MSSKVNPLSGRIAELSALATSDLSVEEQLSGGASTDELIAAGVLYDDYDPENDPAYDFTPLPTEEEMAARRASVAPSPPVSDEEFQEDMRELTKYSRMSAEHRKAVNRRATWT